MTAVNAIGRPFLQLLRIERRLRPNHTRTCQPGGFPRHRIGALRVG